MIWFLYWSALFLAAYYLWQRGWFWTDTTTRRRDFVGFILLAGFGSLLSLLVGL